ncbi:hypothetical protein NLI96_g6214 [Meripilus lineatus]|uniref:Uncharacterized protein n=1 Tax=Meripilus lineatus TaxID=2056292 RepID=A0AAD5YG55_9APHY|nr:hypothetical protein NLI96_g6214 [Physisporinus lineatus]
MPRLHTLQLAITYVGSNIQFAFRKGSPIPPLKSLEFYGAHAYGTLIDEDSLSYFDTLEQLYLVGREEILTFLELSKSESPISIRHLALGIIPSFFDHLEDWQLPSTLETLTFFVDLVPVRRGSLLSDKRSLTIIYNFLRSNIDRLSSGNFRLLVINAISDFANVINDPRQYLLGQGGQDDPLVFVNLKDTSPGFVFDQINDLCDSAGVDVHLNHIGALISLPDHRLYVGILIITPIDIDDWVASRLRDTNPID